MVSRKLTLVCLMLALGCGGGTTPVENVITTPPPDTPVTTATTVPEAGTLSTRSVVVGGVTYRYRVFVPKAYTTATKWPVILGFGGLDTKGEPSTALPLYVSANTATFPTIVVFPWEFPTAEGGQTFALKQAIAIAELDDVVKTYSVDTKREYITGISSGATVSYQLTFQSPTRFAAFVPIAGVPNDPAITGQANAALESSYALVARVLKDLPVWVFQGSNDPSVNVAWNRDLVQAFRDAGANIQYTEIRGGAHSGSTWDVAYGTPALYTWLLAQHR
jgi:predicted peptidase